MWMVSECHIVCLGTNAQNVRQCLMTFTLCANIKFDPVDSIHLRYHKTRMKKFENYLERRTLRRVRMLSRMLFSRILKAWLQETSHWQNRCLGGATAEDARGVLLIRGDLLQSSRGYLWLIMGMTTIRVPPSGPTLIMLSFGAIWRRLGWT